MSILDLSDDLLRKILGHVFFPDIYAAQACRRIQELVRPRIQMPLSNLHKTFRVDGTALQTYATTEQE